MNNMDVEGYLLTLGKLAIFIQLLSEEQCAFIRSGVLTDDEIELAETIKWNCKKLQISLGDQVRMVGERTPKTWEETLKEIMEKLNEDPQKERKTA